MQKWISCCQPKPEAAQHQNHRHNNQAVAYFFHFLMLHSLNHFRRDADLILDFPVDIRIDVSERRNVLYVF